MERLDYLQLFTIMRDVVNIRKNEIERRASTRKIKIVNDAF